MKKILSTIVTLLLALLACGAVAEDVTGEWYAEVYGIVMKMTVNTDNTYVLEAAGEAAPGTWEMDGTNMIVDKGTETESVFTYDAAAQVLDMAGEMTFTRTAIEAWTPASVRAEAELADFEGIWTAQRVNCFGALLPFSRTQFGGMSGDLAGFCIIASLDRIYFPNQDFRHKRAPLYYRCVLFFSRVARQAL